MQATEWWARRKRAFAHPTIRAHDYPTGKSVTVLCILQTCCPILAEKIFLFARTPNQRDGPQAIVCDRSLCWMFGSAPTRH
jgi:hypothetical protein